MTGIFEPGNSLPTYRVRSHNAATASENKIHDNDVAKQYGFSGGLVPGVTVYAYMSQPVVSAFGAAFLERGRMSARFMKPFYELEWCTVSSTVTANDASGISLELQASNDDGTVCAIGTATLPSAANELPDVSSFGVAALPGERQPVSHEVLSGMSTLGTLDETFDIEGDWARYSGDVAEASGLHLGDGALASTGFLIRRANSALSMNVRLNPWIHVSSDVTHHSVLRPGESLQTRSRVRELFERKGHKFVRLDVLMLGDGERPVMSVDHTAIYDIRLV